MESSIDTRVAGLDHGDEGEGKKNVRISAITAEGIRTLAYRSRTAPEAVALDRSATAALMGYRRNATLKHDDFVTLSHRCTGDSDS